MTMLNVVVLFVVVDFLPGLSLSPFPVFFDLFLVERKTVDFSRLSRDFVAHFREFDLSQVHTGQSLCMEV